MDMQPLRIALLLIGSPSAHQLLLLTHPLESHIQMYQLQLEKYTQLEMLLVKCYNSHTSLKKSVFLFRNQLSFKWTTQQLKLLQMTL